MTSHFQDGGRDVISRTKVLPPGEWNTNHLSNAYAAAMKRCLCCIQHGLVY